MQFDCLLGDRKAQAGAARTSVVRLAHSIERTKKIAQLRIGHAASLVNDP